MSFKESDCRAVSVVVHKCYDLDLGTAVYVNGNLLGRKDREDPHSILLSSHFTDLQNVGMPLLITSYEVHCILTTLM